MVQLEQHVIAPLKYVRVASRDMDAFAFEEVRMLEAENHFFPLLTLCPNIHLSRAESDTTDTHFLRRKKVSHMLFSFPSTTKQDTQGVSYLHGHCYLRDDEIEGEISNGKR